MREWEGTPTKHKIVIGGNLGTGGTNTELPAAKRGPANHTSKPKWSFV
jgi:hypothetical protein